MRLEDHLKVIECETIREGHIPNINAVAKSRRRGWRHSIPRCRYCFSPLEVTYYESVETRVTILPIKNFHRDYVWVEDTPLFGTYLGAPS